MKLEHPLENQIRSGKRVCVADSSQADVLSRPAANAFRFEKSAPKRRRFLSVRKRNRPSQHALAEIADRRFASAGGSDVGKLGMRQYFGSGKKADLFSG